MPADEFREKSEASELNLSEFVGGGIQAGGVQDSG